MVNPQGFPFPLTNFFSRKNKIPNFSRVVSCNIPIVSGKAMPLAQASKQASKQASFNPSL